MEDSKVLRLINMLRSSGLNKQDESSLKIDATFRDEKKGKLLDEIKKYEAPQETDLSDGELFDIYKTIANLHKADSNKYQNLLYQIRSIKYKPSELTIRINYLSDFLDVVQKKRDKLNMEAIDNFQKEFIRFRDYSEMRWGRDSKVHNLTLKILEELEVNVDFGEDRISEKMDNFVKKFKDVNRRFRPHAQALDYASQIIYKQYNNGNTLEEEGV